MPTLAYSRPEVRLHRPDCLLSADERKLLSDSEGHCHERFVIEDMRDHLSLVMSLSLAQSRVRWMRARHSESMRTAGNSEVAAGQRRIKRFDVAQSVRAVRELRSLIEISNRTDALALA